MKRNIYIFIAIFVLFCPVPCQSKIFDGIAAIVNDDLITLQDIYSESKPLLANMEKENKLNPENRINLRKTLLERMVEKKLVDQKVKELGIKIDEEEINSAIDDVMKQNNLPDRNALVAALQHQGISFEQYRAQLREQLEKLRLISQEVRSKIQIGAKEVREYYDANPLKYSEEETFRARHIFFRIDEKASSDEIKRAMSNILMVVAEARSGADFAELARKYSEDPAARADGGNLGQFKKGDMLPELEDAIIALKPGEISDIIKTPAGLHIIKLEERNKGKLKPFESVKAEIEDMLYKNKSEERFNAWAKDMRAKATIEIRGLEGLL